MAEPIKYYADAHIPKAVVNQLRKQGVDIVHCAEVGKADAKDIEHLEIAVGEGRGVVTQDRDFLELHAEWQTEDRPHTGIMFVRQTLKGQASIGVIVKELLAYHQLITTDGGSVEQDIANQITYIG